MDCEVLHTIGNTFLQRNLNEGSTTHKLIEGFKAKLDFGSSRNVKTALNFYSVKNMFLTLVQYYFLSSKENSDLGPNWLSANVTCL